MTPSALQNMIERCSRNLTLFASEYKVETLRQILSNLPCIDEPEEAVKFFKDLWQAVEEIDELMDGKPEETASLETVVGVLVIIIKEFTND